MEQQPRQTNEVQRHAELNSGLANTLVPDSARPENGQTFATQAPQPALQAAATQFQIPKYFGDYEILEEIARGGMGVVYKARQVRLNRTVALKMILAGQFASDEEIQRFFTEAEAAANLDHPGIVPVFEIGQFEGHHFFSMAYMEGCSLAARVKQGPLCPGEAAELCHKIAEALSYAHSKGVIHRDLKPANILLDALGEPKITDFGLARRSESQSDLTRTGAILGTPGYMPPEQASGNIHDVGPCSDIYSVGAILYCLLTGRPPFQAATPMETLYQVIEQEPASVAVLNPAVPRDLETICHKCLRKDPAKRYRSAAELADDLQRWQNGEPITARAVSSAERVLRWVRRNQLLAGLVAMTVFTILTGVAAITVFGIRAAVSEATALSSLARTSFLLAVSRWEDGRVEEAGENLAHVSDQHREFEWYVLLSLLDRSLLTVPMDAGGVECVAVSDDGKMIATGGVNGVIHVIDTATGTVTFSCIGHEAEVNAVDFHPNSSLLVSASSDKTVALWDMEEGARRAVMKGHPGGVEDVEFSPDGSRIASCCDKGLVHFWSTTDGRQISTGLKHADAVFSVAFSPDGSSIVTACGDQYVTVWSVQLAQKLWAREVDQYSAMALEYCPDGNTIAVAGASGRIWLIDASNGQLQFDLNGNSTFLNDLKFSPDGRLLASCGGDSRIRIWELSTRRLASELCGHEGSVNKLAFSPDGARLVSGGADQMVKVWDAAIVHDAALQKDNTEISSAAVTPDGRQILLGTADGKVSLKGVDSDDISSLPEHDGRVTSLCFSRDGQLIATAGEDGLVRILDTETKMVLRQLAGHTDFVTCVAFSPDGQQIISASRDCSVRLWDVLNGAEIRAHRNAADFIQCVCFSPDGRQYACGDTGFNVRLWDSRTGQMQRLLEGHANSLTALEYSPDGRMLSTADANGFMRLWQPADGSLLKEVHCHPNLVFSVIWTEDGSRLLTDGYEDKIRVWNVATGEELLSFPNTEPQYWRVSFALQGRQVTLATGCELDIAFSPLSTVPGSVPWQRFSDPRSTWHLSQAEALEKSEDWFAAAFHRTWRSTHGTIGAEEQQQLQFDLSKLKSSGTLPEQMQLMLPERRP